jgi:hypothetical protein
VQTNRPDATATQVQQPRGVESSSCPWSIFDIILLVAAVLTNVARLLPCDVEILQLQTLRYQLEVCHRRSLVDGACGFKIDYSKGVDHGEVVDGWYFDYKK